MVGSFDPPMTPKDGRQLRILVPVRVSDPTKQDERSLGDQRHKIEKFLNDHANFPFELTVLEGRESGELLDRAEYVRLTEEVATGRYDAVVAEDLGRIVRRIHAHIFCEECFDFGTRVIALNDNVDTGRDGWQDASIFSAWHHERSNRDTSQRIKRTQRSRFLQGWCLSCHTFGYKKPIGAKSDNDLHKDPAAEPILKEWFRMLDEEDANFAEIARWLRAKSVPLPPYARQSTWDGKIVGRITFNPILKGMRERNRRKTQRTASGHYRSIKAPPNELLQRRVPHLAFFEEQYYDRVTRKIHARNRIYRFSENGATDPRSHRPKKHSRFPGRVTFCGICGRSFVWGGHGQAGHLMCNGVRSHQCWNAVTFDGALASSHITKAILNEVEGLPEFDPVFAAVVNEEAQRLNRERSGRQFQLTNDLTEVDKSIGRIVAFVCKSESAPASALHVELARLEQEKINLQADLVHLSRQPAFTVKVPPVADLRVLAHKCISEQDPGDPDFLRAIRSIVPKILVFPFRLCDGLAIVLRAKFRLELGNLLPDRDTAAALREPLTRVLTVNLFKMPQREFFRQQILALRSSGKTEAEAAGECKITVTAAQKAAALQRRMDQLELTDPYFPVKEPPEVRTRLKCYKHPDYCFTPLAGAGEL